MLRISVFFEIMGVSGNEWEYTGIHSGDMIELEELKRAAKQSKESA
jgi:hypothetical protein